MQSEAAAAALGDPAPPRAAEGLVRHRQGWKARVNAWRKRTPFNPYWLERVHLWRAAEFLAPKASGVLLDVGGGERPYGKLFEPYVDRYLGLEYPAACDNLNPEIWAILKRISTIVDVWGDGGRLPFADRCVDTVLLSEVMEHVPEPQRILDEVQRVLRPGGRALVTVPFIAPLHQLPYDFYRYTHEGLRSMFERAGLEVESIDPRGNSAAATGSLLAQSILRSMGARSRNFDGSVTVSRWRAPFVLPLIAAVQMFFSFASRFSDDRSMCMGWTAVARKPEAS